MPTRMRPEPRRTRSKAAQPKGSLRARIVALAKEKRPSLVAFIDSLPPGTRTKEDIDRQFEELRGSSHSGKGTLTIPAHIENGRVILDVALPPDIESVEVRGRVRARAVPGSGGRTLSNALRVALARAPGKGDPAKFLALLKTLPPGEMTAAEIDREIAEVRSNRGD